MKALGGCTRSRRFSCLARRRWHRPRSAVLSLVLLGLSIGISNAQTTTTSQPREHIYLLRGAFNVFSLGMDQIAAKLQQHGIHATVDNYLAWPNLAERAAAEYRSGRAQTIILVGHSSGAIAVTSMAARLSELGNQRCVRNGMSIGTRRLYELVGIWTKLRQQKAFLGTCFHP